MTDISLYYQCFRDSSSTLWIAGHLFAKKASTSPDHHSGGGLLGGLPCSCASHACVEINQ